MLSRATIQVARRLEVPLRELSAMVVPMAAGGRDAHGCSVQMDDEIRGRLSLALQSAARAIREAEESLRTGG